MGTTTRHGWPTPDDTDKVAQGAAAMRTLAAAIDDDVPRTWVGTATITFSNVTDASVSVTFPAGTFTAAPVVVATPTGGQVVSMRTSGTTATGCTVSAYRVTGQPWSGSIVVGIIATQPLTGAAAADEPQVLPAAVDVELQTDA